MRTVKIILSAAVALALASCSNNSENGKTAEAPKAIPRQHFIDNIKKQEAQMHKSMELDPNVATLAVQAYSDFVKQFPADSLSPDFLFRAAEVSTASRQYPQALMFYQQITTSYPGYRLYPESLYLQAYVMDNYLNEDDKAKLVYEQVIAKYPGLPYAKDAQAAISHLGKSDEELVREFEKKNKGK